MFSGWDSGFIGNAARRIMPLFATSRKLKKKRARDASANLRSGLVG